MDLFKDEKIDTIEFLRLLYQKKSVIAGALAVSLALSVVVTYFIPPKFVSYGTIFPPFSNSLEEVIQRPDFGFDLQADRIMQILESKAMRDSIVNEFDLVNYYELDTTELDWKFKLDKKFVRDITFFRSKYMSIVISARTKSPHLSANIVNSIIHRIDAMREQIFQENFQQQYTTVEKEYLAQQRRVNELMDSLNARVKRDPTGSLNILFLKASYGLVAPENREVQIPLESERLLSEYVTEKERLNILKEKFEVTKSKVNQPFQKVYIVDKAEPALKKVSPSYRLNALIAVSVTLVLSILALLFSQKFQSIRAEITQ